MQAWMRAAATAAVLLPLMPVVAAAGEPKFEYRAPPDDAISGIEWKASAQAGLILTTGNSRTTTIAGGAKASRKSGKNKLELEATGAFARSSLFLASDVNGDGAISEFEVQRVSQTTTRAWAARSRYDRFLTERNALYATGLVSADKPAGKQLVAGGQVGYSRTLVKNAVHEVVVEAGYDFSYENFEGADNAISIHSARTFAGYQGKLSEDSSLSGSTEMLFNANGLDTPTGHADPLEDLRVHAKLGLNTKIYEDVSFRFGFTARYDNVPAPRPAFAIPYAEGFVPAADRLDTITEATLIVNLL